MCLRRPRFQDHPRAQPTSSARPAPVGLVHAGARHDPLTARGPLPPRSLRANAALSRGADGMGTRPPRSLREAGVEQHAHRAVALVREGEARWVPVTETRARRRARSPRAASRWSTRFRSRARVGACPLADGRSSDAVYSTCTKASRSVFGLAPCGPSAHLTARPPSTGHTPADEGSPSTGSVSAGPKVPSSATRCSVSVSG
jgi:hypothetical protein